MEIDQLKSATTEEDQMEMMLLMDKLPEFYSPYNDVANLAAAEFPAAINIGNNTTPHFIDKPQVSISTPFTNPSFTNDNAAIEDQSRQDFLSNRHAGRWRSAAAGEFPGANAYSMPSQKRNSMAAMREMIFRMAAMQPIHIDPESVKPPKRRNVKISKDPQSVAARHRRERISERIRILQRLVPGGTKMDTASMLDEAIHYVKFLKTQVQSLERAQASNRPATGIGFPVAMSSGSYLNVGKAYQHHQQPLQNVQNYGDAN